MAELATAFVRVRPNLTGFKAEAAAGTREAGAALGKIFALAFGTVAAEELARHVVTVAAQQDAMFAKIRQLTKSAGADWEVYGKTVQEAIIAKSESSGFAVDQLASAYGRLIQQTKNSRQALALLTTASDVARARGTAVTQVATSLSRALGGNAQALSRLGIIVPKYTAAQDAAKKKLQELADAEQYLNMVRRGVTPIKLDDQAQAYSRQGETQRAELKRTLTAQLAAAAASDKLIGAQKTLAEVGARFKGQGTIFGETAAGQADRFQISIHELEVSVGEHLIPLLGGAAEQGRKWAQALGDSASVGHAAQAVAENIASGVKGAASAIAAIYPAIKLSAEAIQAVLSTIGAGPLLAAYAAYKGLVVVTGAYAIVQKKITAGSAALTAARAREAGATTAATEASAASTAAAEVNAEALTAVAVASQAAATGMLRYTATQGSAIGVTAGETVAIEAEGAAAATAAGEIGILDAALAGLGAGAAIAGLAVLAGLIYYQSTLVDENTQKVHELARAYGDLKDARAQASKTAVTDKGADQAITSARIARQQAAEQLRTANAQLEADYNVAHPSNDKLRQDQLGIAQAADQWRRANQTLLDSEKAKTQASKDSSAAIKSERDATKQLVDKQIELAYYVQHAGMGARGEDGSKRIAAYADNLRKLAEDTKATTAAQRFGLKSLADYIDATGKIPDNKTLTLTLNDAVFYNKLQRDIGVLKGAGQALLDAVLPKDTADAGSRGAAALPVRQKRKLTVDVADATLAGVTQAGPSIASQVAKAFKDAVLQAKQSLTSIGSDLANQVGTLLDAQLAAAEAKIANGPTARTIRQLTAEATRLQAQTQNRDAGQQIANQLAALQGLQRAFGPGAHTADQDLQLAQAQTAYQDALDSQKAATDTAQASSLQTQLDNQKAWLEKRNDTEKTAAARRIADLNDELNRGLITEQQYAARLPAILRAQGVHFKDAGSLLGKAFSDGFQEQLAAALKQAKALAQLTPAERGRGTGSAPIITDPRKVAQTTRQGLVQSQDHSATAKNTADTVAELKKLGAVIDKAGTHVHITIPPDVSKKDTAQIVKLAKSLK